MEHEISTKGPFEEMRVNDATEDAFGWGQVK